MVAISITGKHPKVYYVCWKMITDNSWDNMKTISIVTEVFIGEREEDKSQTNECCWGNKEFSTVGIL